ncbi:MAG: carboxylesterase family protein, partial [Pseudomonadales bacterium]|nr:carboxylesterase family protein [Pseudomonadales bacterium]
MKKIIAVLVLIPVLIVVGLGTWVYISIQPEEPVARLPSPSSVRSTLFGEVKGVSDRYETHAWLGIPYASAQRWRAPRDPDTFDTVYEAYDFGSRCPQVSLLGEQQGQVV